VNGHAITFLLPERSTQRDDYFSRAQPVERYNPKAATLCLLGALAVLPLPRPRAAEQGKTPARIVSAPAASRGAGKNPSENRFSPGREPRSREKPQREPFSAPRKHSKIPSHGKSCPECRKARQAKSDNVSNISSHVSRGGDRYPSHSPNIAIMLLWCWQLSQS
jgi:hypothetical protein